MPLSLEYMPVVDLPVDERNPKGHALDEIDASMSRFGYVDPVVIDERTGKLLSGHGRREVLLARQERGEPPPLNVEVGPDGRWLAPVVRGVRTTSDIEAGALIVGVNELVAAGGWDPDMLAPLLESIRAESSLVGTGFTNEGLDELLESLALERGDGGHGADDGDAIPEDVPAVTQQGDLWSLGPHRVLCDDSTDPAALDRVFADVTVGVVLTDPPYGINLDTDYSSISGSKNSMLRQNGKRLVIANSYRRVEHDDVPFDASHLSSYFGGVVEQFWFGANYYRRTLPGTDLDGSWFVWDKRPAAWNEGSEGIDDVIGAGFELVWSKRKHQQRVLRHMWSGFTARNKGIERAHPTEKPVDLLSDILERWAPSGCVVADPFAGSGTTLIAAHRTSRTARLAELDPRYVDVICARYQQGHGRQAGP